ncbi:GMC family oxidoreductase N-terminal domain-containing protein [Spiractinospora alimapuensis]|uniref:GMC family oxidoreductase n=1 Tax=Spiractinospora alimapuensis TaxID=2820884 RepID=UPI001F465277|nr:GMC family oxidoreductase N-terminal domain-containing protein [Spiractinospora alimapuensis]QVQ53896.1 GMC family oxidoreductase N-terminal domain-containing protein [Spiractinospora alimapuensis]
MTARRRSGPEFDADFIVVGAGSAGCVLAERLSADPDISVLLVEAGGPNTAPLLRVPMAFARTTTDPRFATHHAAHLTEPTDRIEPWIRGRGLGGSSAINGMMYLRGDAADYDALAGRGFPGFTWPAALSAFRAMEDHTLGGSALRGSGGPLRVQAAPPVGTVSEAVLEVSSAMGWPRVDDVNAAEGARIGPVPSTIDRGTRVSAATAFLRPALRRRNLTVLTDARVGHLLLDADRGRRDPTERDSHPVGVRGVVVRRRGSTRELRCRREVIVAAGTVESPLLLERSGIGDPEVLRNAGVAPRVASPRVGEGVVEHRAVPVRVRLRPGLGRNAALSSRIGLLRGALRYAVSGSGPLTTGPYDLAAFVCSAPDVPRPDVLSLWTAMSADPGAEHLRAAPYPALTVTSYPLRPTTESSVHLSGPDPADPPVIEARYLRTQEDRDVSEGVLHTVRTALATGPLSHLVAEEEAPGPNVGADGTAWSYALDAGGGLYHAVGSCSVASGGQGVVDDELRVRGVAGLRVVDASVFPRHVSGGTAAPVMALAWHMSARIQES